MLRLSERARKFIALYQGQPLDRSFDYDSILTGRQFEVVVEMFNTKYHSRCSFEKLRFCAQYFVPRQGETIREFVVRNSHHANGNSYLAFVRSDEAHEANGLVLMPNGGLAIFHSDESQKVIYSAIENVLERDALLEECRVEFVGTVSFISTVTCESIISRMKDFLRYEPASDEENVVMQSVDSVCVLQFWYRHYIPDILKPKRDCTMRIFSRNPSVFNSIAKRFDGAEIRCAVSEPSRF